MKVVGYVRVSTDHQVLGIETQRDQIKKYASLYGLELVDVIEDRGASAKTLDRPGMHRALAMLGSGEADGLLVAKLDRLTRSVRDIDTLIHAHFEGRALMSVAEQIDTRSAAGRLVLNILASVSQWERETIGERTSAAMRHKASQGEYTGGHAPYGYAVGADGVNLVEVAEEQQVLAIARSARASGLSLRAIAQHLKREGFTTRTGRAFQAVQILRMCTHPKILI
jgi:DNA invertase Pin-like site-specific DNA recombinase